MFDIYIYIYIIFIYNYCLVLKFTYAPYNAFRRLRYTKRDITFMIPITAGKYYQSQVEERY